MKRYDFDRLKYRASGSEFYLIPAERESLASSHPNILLAWQNAEAALDYVHILLERQLDEFSNTEE